MPDRSPPWFDPETSLAEGCADFLTRLALRLGAPPEAAAVAGEAGRACLTALAAGHVCADIETLAGRLRMPTAQIAASLRDSRVAAPDETGGMLPLVLDGQGRIYLYRYFAYERRLAAAIANRLSAGPSRPPSEEERQFLAARFAANTARLAGRPDRQRLAAAQALVNPLTIISGGPGTGKTTIVATLITALAMGTPPPRIALAAPTGKAAARMEAALARTMETIDPDLASRLPQRASTIHRLLGARRESEEFRHHRGNPLPYDALIVDEASMLDLSLAARLFDALPPDCRIVMLGDRDQLSAVEAGAVFAELTGEADDGDSPESSREREGEPGFPPSSAPGAMRPSLPGCVVRLRENYRFDAASPIGKMAALVSGGDADGLVDWLRELDDEALLWRPVGDGLPASIIETLAAGFAAYGASVAQGDPGAALRAYEDFRVLCVLRRGKRGVTGLNEAIARRLRPRLAGGGHDSPWYRGRPVMVTENDYDLEVFNGDIGIALPGRDGRLEVWFRNREGDLRSVPPPSLPAHQTAFAVTVHKAQGSEFENAALILPETDLPILTRELIYTAVTRARRRIAIYGSLEILRAAVARPTRRRSGLAARIVAIRAGGS
ncbi:MAG: exodeoxyribonuclease V subunit alpha [Pseudomonadota bacterium]|nr:exodeoxyribonuclease V subunit alpha [Pseudomonadota bacterium]